MMLTGASIAGLIERSDTGDPLVVAPLPDLEALRLSGSAALDLRLGTWFQVPKRASVSMLPVNRQRSSAQLSTQKSIDPAWTDCRHVPLGRSFILHPRSFVLAVTLEWIRIPTQYAGYVSGKSSWGRRGLVIETAPGVHPGFSGCLTLELANMGEVPLELVPGIRICQLFLHMLDGAADSNKVGQFVGRRRPTIGSIETDEFVERLSEKPL